MPDYYKDRKAINSEEIYEHLFEARGVDFIEQFRTKTFEDINTKNIRVYRHTWRYGDTMHKLSVQYYGTGIDWWVIGLVNGKPTDAHYAIGDTTLIPISPNEMRR